MTDGVISSIGQLNSISSGTDSYAKLLEEAEQYAVRDTLHESEQSEIFTAPSLLPQLDNFAEKLALSTSDIVDGYACDRTRHIPLRQNSIDPSAYLRELKLLSNQYTYLQPVIDSHTEASENQNVALYLKILNQVLYEKPEDFVAIIKDLTHVIISGTDANAELLLNYQTHFMLSVFKLLFGLSYYPNSLDLHTRKEILFNQAFERSPAHFQELTQLFKILETLDQNIIQQIRNQIPTAIAPVYKILVNQTLQNAPLDRQIQKAVEEGWRLCFETNDFNIFSSGNNNAFALNVGNLQGVLHFNRNDLVFGVLLFNALFVPVIISEEEVLRKRKLDQVLLSHTQDMVIVTDSSASFPKYFRARHLIHIVDTSKEFDQKTFQNKYQELLAQGYKQIFSIHVNASISNSYDRARRAAKIIAPDKIKVFDSNSFSLGLGLLVQEAAVAIFNQKTPYQIERIIRKCMQSQHHWVILNSLSQLNTKFNFQVENGAEKYGLDILKYIAVLSIKEEMKVTGCFLKLLRAKDFLIKSIEYEFTKRKAFQKIAIEYNGMYYPCLRLLKKLKEKFPHVEIAIYEAGPYTSRQYGTEMLGVSII